MNNIEVAVTATATDLNHRFQGEVTLRNQTNDEILLGYRCDKQKRRGENYNFEFIEPKNSTIVTLFNLFVNSHGFPRMKQLKIILDTIEGANILSDATIETTGRSPGEGLVTKKTCSLEMDDLWFGIIFEKENLTAYYFV